MNSNTLTEQYFDRMVIMPRLIGSDLPDMTTHFLGQTYATPVTTAALSHLGKYCGGSMVDLADAAKSIDALYFCGMTQDDEIEQIVATGAKVISIIKPHAKNEEIIRQIEHAKRIGCVGVGVDIEHAYSTHKGDYDVCEGYPLLPKTSEDLKELVAAAGDLPFVLKGVLSVEDAILAKEAGVKGFIVTHHSNIMDSSIPPLMILPEIRKAVGPEIGIAVDCCFKTGTDVFKGLALGADVVSIGKPLMKPLAEKKAEGAAAEMTKITNELKGVMARCGYKTVDSIDDSRIRFI